MPHLEHILSIIILDINIFHGHFTLGKPQLNLPRPTFQKTYHRSQTNIVHFQRIPQRGLITEKHPSVKQCPTDQASLEIPFL